MAVKKIIFIISVIFLCSFGEPSKFHLNFLRLPGQKISDPANRYRFLMEQLKRRTNIEPSFNVKEYSVNDKELYKLPFFVIYGCSHFDNLTAEEEDRISLFLKSGGTIFIDSCDPEELSDFIPEIKEEFLKILPGNSWIKLPEDHVIYQTFYLLDYPTGAKEEYPYLEGMNIGGRTAVILSRNDLLGCVQQDSFGNFIKSLDPGWNMQREFCIRDMINLFFYVLTGSYKDDQLHAPYILEKRQKKGFYHKWEKEMIEDVKKRREKFIDIQNKRRNRNKK